MGSNGGMKYAVMMTSSGWAVKTAEEILKIREKYGDNSTEYNKIRYSFRCKGCYDSWLKIHNSEPSTDQLTSLSHYNRDNAGGTHFQLRKNEIQHKVKGCYYNDPFECIRNQSDNYTDVVLVNNGERARLNILKINTIGQPYRQTDSKQSSPKNNRSNPRRSFGCLQELYVRFDDEWTELPIETEDGQKVNIKDLIVSVQQAKIKAREKEDSIFIVIGTVKKVLNRNRGGYINIIFKEDKKHPFFQLSVSPNHIYNEEDLMCLENRKIGCYGRVYCNSRYQQMDLRSVDHQVVFMDINESNPPPVVTCQLKISRIKDKIMNTLKKSSVEVTNLNDNHFTFYTSKRNEIIDLERQISIKENQKKHYYQEYKQLNQALKDSIREHKDLLSQYESCKEKHNGLVKELETKKQRLLDKISYMIKGTYSNEVFELQQNKNKLDKEINQLEQKINELETLIKKVSVQENKYKQAIEEIDQTIKESKKEIHLNKQGLKWEVEWKQLLRSDNVYIFHKPLLKNSEEDLLIAFKMVHSNESAELKINIFFQYHWKNEFTKLSSNTINCSTIRIHPADLFPYKTLEKNLNVINKIPNVRQTQVKFGTDERA